MIELCCENDDCVLYWLGFCDFVILWMVLDMLVVKMCCSVCMCNSSGCVPGVVGLAALTVVARGALSVSMTSSWSESESLSSIFCSTLGALAGDPGLGRVLPRSLTQWLSWWGMTWPCLPSL